MIIPQDTIAQIRARNDIVEVISSYVPLKRSGRNYVGLCPFHNEKTPSFSVMGDRQIYYCFGCGAGGDVISFVRQYENLTFFETMDFLAQRAGMEIPKGGEYDKAAHDKKAKTLEVLKEAASFYYRKLRSPEGEAGMRYFKERGLSDKVMKDFGLGYAGKGKDNLISYLKDKGYDITLINDAGLCIIDEKHGPRDRFFNRVIFPIQDMGRKVIGFGGRVMGDGMPKYLNSPETDIFNKRKHLYGYCYAKTARSDNIILCEGYMDVIAMHQAGFTQAVASLGTAFTEQQAALIGRVAKKVYIAYDSDNAGVNAALRAIDIFKNTDISVKVMSLKPCKDPDELIKAQGPQAIDDRMKNAENAFMFKVRHAEDEFDLDDPDGRSGFLKKVAGFLCEITQEIKRENYLLTVAKRYDISVDILRRLLKDVAMSIQQKAGSSTMASQDPSFVNINTAAFSNPDNIDFRGRGRNKNQAVDKSERLLLAYLCTNVELYQKVRPYIAERDFCDDLCRRVAEMLFKELEQGIVDPAGIVGAFDETESPMVAGIFYEEIKGMGEDEKENKRVVKDLLVKVRTAGYMRDVAGMGKDPDGLSKIIKGKKDIEQLKKIEI